MPIDASIPLGVKPVQIDSPFESYAKAEQIKGLRAQGQYRDLQMQELMDKRMREQGRRGILSRGLQGEELAGALEQGGYLDDASGIRKQMTEGEKARLEMAEKRIGLRNQLLQAVIADPREQVFFGAAKEYERVSGEKLPDEFYASIYELRNDPEKIRRAAAGYVMKPEQLLPKTDTRDVGGQIIDRSIDPLSGLATETGRMDKTLTPESILTDERTRAEGAAGRAVTIRGQNMTDARAREAAAITAATGKASDWQYDGDRGVLINKRTGETKTPTGLEGKPVKLTEGQGKAFMFGNRAAEADRIITDLTGKYSPTALAAKSGAGKVWGVGGALEMGANAMLGESEQKAEQAQRDFINAVLRQESGAVIADSEFDNAKKQYFPQPGDSAQVIKQKAANRLRAIEGFRVVSGPVADQIGGEPKARTGASGNWEPQKVETDNLPDPAQYVGAVMTDSQTGMRYKSDGKGWVRQ